MNSLSETQDALSSNWRLLQLSEILQHCFLDDDQGQLSQTFHAHARHCTVSLAQKTYCARWQYSEQIATHYIILEGGDATIPVSVERYPLPVHAQQRAWWEYSEATRWLAWGIEHETLVDLLQVQFGCKLRPTHHAFDRAMLKARSNLRWCFEHDGAAMVGTALLDSTMLRRLHNNHWNTDTPPPLRSQLTDRLKIEIFVGEMLVSELQDTLPGDVFLLDNLSPRIESVLVQLPAAGVRWNATVHEKRITLNSTAIKRQYRNPVMINEQYSLSVNEENSVENRSSVLSLQQMQVQLALQLGEVEISLGELEHLQPGYVIELPHTISSVRPAILANGQMIGRGELVHFGNRLGVRITAWGNNGL